MDVQSGGSATEVEDYSVNLPAVLSLELEIDPGAMTSRPRQRWNHPGRLKTMEKTDDLTQTIR